MRVNEKEIQFEGKMTFIHGVISCIIMVAIMFSVTFAKASEKNQNEDEIKTTVYESQDHETVISSANALTTEVITTTEETTEKYCRNLSENDKYLLAKIAMAEAEGAGLETKILVIETVLNRVNSSQFPNTVEDVIFQKSNGIYQYSVVCSGGRWWTTTPNEECWDAVEIVNDNEQTYNSSQVYYFESCSGESWHSKNLEFVCQSGNIRFYK